MFGLHSRSIIVACVSALCVPSLLGCKSKARYTSVGAGKGKDGGDGSSSLDGSTKVASSRRDGGLDGGRARSGEGGLVIPPGATLDAAALGLDASLALPDGSLILQDGAILLPDGEVIDVDAAVMRYKPEIDVTSCAISASDTYRVKVDIADEGGFSLVPGQTGFGLAYRAIGSGSCAQDIAAMHIPATSGFPEPRSVLPDCKVVRDVSLLGTSDGWRLAWVDNFTDMAELHTLTLDLDLNVASGQSRKQLTDNQLELEQKPVLAEIDGRAFAAWIANDMATQKFHVSTRLLDGDAASVDVVKEDDGQEPTGLAFAQMGSKTAAIGWVGPQYKPGVWLLKLDADGAPVDTPIQLTDRVAASSSIGLANRVNGGGAIYSIEVDGVPQVRFRRLDDTGQPLAVERSIVGPPLQGQGASIAALGGGYVVVYRALPGGGVTDPEVRLTFITKEGNVINDMGGHLVSFPIGAATRAEGRTYVSVSVEGEVMVAWIDADTSSAKNVLQVVRRRLDCR